MALALVKEDGTGRVDANSYVNVADGDAYFEGHLYATVWTAASTALASCSRLAEWRRTIAAVRIAPSGLALPVPAMSGAEPCTGS